MATVLYVKIHVLVAWVRDLYVKIRILVAWGGAHFTCKKLQTWLARFFNFWKPILNCKIQLQKSIFINGKCPDQVLAFCWALLGCAWNVLATGLYIKVCVLVAWVLDLYMKIRILMAWGRVLHTVVIHANALPVPLLRQVYGPGPRANYVKHFKHFKHSESWGNSPAFEHSQHLSYFKHGGWMFNTLNMFKMLTHTI